MKGVAREARFIQLDPDVSPASRQAAQRIEAAVTKPNDLELAEEALERAGVSREKRWRP